MCYNKLALWISRVSRVRFVWIYMFQVWCLVMFLVFWKIRYNFPYNKELQTNWVLWGYTSPVDSAEDFRIWGKEPLARFQRRILKLSWYPRLFFFSFVFFCPADRKLSASFLIRKKWFFKSAEYELLDWWIWDTHRMINDIYQ